MYKAYVVDDDAEFRRSIIQSVNRSKTGFSVCGEADNGADALAEILKVEPDLLITDIRMPFMSGLELAYFVKKKLPDLSILLLSASDSLEFAHEAIRIGVLDYLIKPVGLEKIRDCLMQASARLKQTPKPQASKSHGNKQLDLSKITSAVHKEYIQKFISNGNQSDVDRFCRKIMEYVEKCSGPSNLAYICSLYDVVTTVNYMAEVSEIHVPHVYELFELEDRTNHEEDEKQLANFLHQIIRERDSTINYKMLLTSRAKTYIKENYQDPELSLRTVAAQVGVSSNYLSTLFNRECHESYSDYLTRIRLSQAVSLLKTTSLSIEEIAKKVGYSDRYYLSRVFRKNMGVTLREYRKINNSPK